MIWATNAYDVNYRNQQKKEGGPQAKPAFG
uniref:Uncharacterized protein n=1 Tax=Vitis vinifera TaxID=29760 RepID=F6H226_VITVI